LPREPLGQDFRVLLTSDLPEHGAVPRRGDAGRHAADEYRYDFTIEQTPRGVRVCRKVSRSESVAERVGRPRATRDAVTIASGTRATDDPTSHPGSLECGSFHGTMYYAPWSCSARRLQDLHIHAGVFVYRDGVRVEPSVRATNDMRLSEASGCVGSARPPR